MKLKKQPSNSPKVKQERDLPLKATHIMSDSSSSSDCESSDTDSDSSSNTASDSTSLSNNVSSNSGKTTAIGKQENINSSKIKQEDINSIKIKQENISNESSDSSSDSDNDSSDSSSAYDSSDTDSESKTVKKIKKQEMKTRPKIKQEVDDSVTVTNKMKYRSRRASENSDSSDGDSSEDDSSDSDSSDSTSAGDSSDTDSGSKTVKKNIKQEMKMHPKIKQEMKMHPKIKQEMKEPSCRVSEDSDSSDGDSSSKMGLQVPSEFDIVKSPGPLTVNDIKPEYEYYIFRFPSGLINPTQLADTKFRIGSKNAQEIMVNNKSFEVSSYDSPAIADTPTLFLPDHAGQLNQVDLKITSQVVIKQPPLTVVGNKKFNIDDLRSKIHKPPEIKERNFFARSDAVKMSIKTEEPFKNEKKHSNKEKKEKKHSNKEKKEKKHSNKEKKEKKHSKKEKKEKKHSKKEKRSLNIEESLSPSLSPKKKKKKN